MKIQKLMIRPSVKRMQPVLSIWISIFCLMACTDKKTIRVGFVAQLTGVQAKLGVEERDGVQLAVDEINIKGGIDGRAIELVVRDDLGTPEGARTADKELIEAGVVAIIGHATSAQTLAGLAVTNSARVVMLSPSATTPELGGLEDYFFRVSPSLSDRAHAFAQRIYQGRNISRVAVICDTDNSAYSKAFLKAFGQKYHSLGGELVSEVDFSSKKQPDFDPMVAKLQEGNPDGLLIIAADMDTAMIAQRTRLMGWPVPLFTSAWAQTETLINSGGRAVEGLEIEIANTFKNQTPAYLDFERRYLSRYGKTPAFGAPLGYEAAMVLAAALKITDGETEGLAKALVDTQNFRGLTHNLSMDRYGDVIRPFYLGIIRNGTYMDIEAPIPIEHRD